MVTNEMLANELSASMSGESIEMLHNLPDPVKLYVMKLAWQYYSRRFNMEYQFENSGYSRFSDQPIPNVFLGSADPDLNPIQDLGNNNRLPHLEREIQDFNEEVPATTQIYGTAIDYQRLPNQGNTNLGNSALGQVYPTIYAGQSDVSEFSSDDGFYGSGSPDSAEY